MKRFPFASLSILLAGLFWGCGPSAHESAEPQNRAFSVQSVPLSPVTGSDGSPSGGGAGPRFTRLPVALTGVDFVNPIDKDHPLKHLYISGYACGGVAIGDVDGDGRPDLYLVSGPLKNKLYRQVGDLKFEDITVRAGVDGGDAWGTGAAMVDIDNDGDLDVYVSNYDSPNRLYVNDGEGTFTENAKSYGLAITDASLMSTFCDYDADGDLDLYLVANRYYRAAGRPGRPPFTMVDGQPRVLPEFEKYYGVRRSSDGKYTMDSIGRTDRLFRNNGNATFTDVTRQAGMGGREYGLSATWWDYNQDGWLDLYVANDFNDPDHLYRNNGDGTFTDVLKDVIPHTSWFSMGADVADINNDGRFDFLVADMSATNHFKQKTTMGAMSSERILEVAGPPPQIMRNALYLNTGTDRFMEIAYLAGLADTDWTWSIKFADLDVDGLEDVYVTNGAARNFNNSDVEHTLDNLVGRPKWSIYEDTPTRPEQNLAYHNRGDLRFEDVSSTWGLDHLGMSFAAAYSDLDRDGDLDIVVVNLDEPVSVYRNRSSTGHRVLVRLRGTQSNRFGVGARADIETATGKQSRQLIPVTGFLSANEPLVHFGLGRDEKIDKLTVRWPSGVRQTLENLDVDRFYTITEPNGTPPERTVPPTKPTLFRQNDSLAHAVHSEKPYDDFQRQPLLPNKLSQLGPGMAWGDVDGNGSEDFYLSGAAGQPGALYLRGADGSFKRSEEEAFQADAGSEDMAPLLFDVDADGDLDLYVVSGGVECGAGDALLRDRLYLNDGHGRFTPAAADSLPDRRDSGSAAAAADFDRDGDLDLFVGSRVIPGQYPLTPDSLLLQNDQGRFTDITDTLATGLRNTGMVTGAVWSDADDDGWIDLLIAQDWGPVKLYHNDHGKLVDRTVEAGLHDQLGWWNGIAGRDLDGDGDMDYAVTNFGLNTKYHASADKPALLYYGDFENQGRMRLVEAEYEDETLFPIRGKSCSTAAMPFLKKKYSTFKAFALADLDEIYSKKCLQTAHRFAATTLNSGVLINDGRGRFEFQPLPRLAQAAPGFGVVLTDVNGDGHTDLYMAQNFFGPQLETGRMDGGLSLLLLGEENAKFAPVWPDRSGLLVPGDAKSLALTDLNDDGRPDFVVGVNDDQVLVFENESAPVGKMLNVRLQGVPGNPTAIGARVSVHLEDGSLQCAEVHAGSGYLSQSTSALYFGLRSSRVKEIAVRWPDGQSTTTQTPAAGKALISHPSVGKNE